MRVLGMDLGSRRVKICSMVEGQIEKQEKYGIDTILLGVNFE